jgi:glucosamine--fructose-6-phosphate aminotransferase (isomerizing)
MCGIIALLGCNFGDQPLYTTLLNGLKILQNRGYDSAGIAMINNTNIPLFTLNKYASTNDETSILKLEKDTTIYNSKNYKIGIGHSRWSTHGQKTDQNSHPHIDYKNRIALVHNGIIENYYPIKQRLLKENIDFKSETDTEVIVNLISHNLDKYMDIERAIEESIDELQGTWSLVIMYLGTPNKLYLSKNGSPLLVSLSNDFAMVSSEQSGFMNLTKNFICLNDGDIAVLNKENDKITFRNIWYKKPKSYKLNEIDLLNFKLTPEPYPYWTIKEIYEQEFSIKRAMNMGGRISNDSEVKLGGLNDMKEQLLKIDNLIILACGTSYHAGLIGKTFFQDLCTFNAVQVIDGAEFNERDIPSSGNTGLLLLSQSGETKDLHRGMEIAKNKNLTVIGIINSVGSMIARESDCGVYLNCGREVAVASTKCFTSQIVVLGLMALWFSQNSKISQNIDNKRGVYIKSLQQLSEQIKQVLTLDEQCKQIAQELKHDTSCFLLGKGKSEAIAREGALKIKEISYIHAEGYSGSALKHGPYALLTNNTPIIIISPDDEYFTKMTGVAEEVKSRKAKTILITDKTDILNTSIYDHVITVPQNKYFNSILSVIPLQLLAYYLSLSKEINPDMPRNLAKTVTVD